MSRANQNTGFMSTNRTFPIEVGCLLFGSLRELLELIAFRDGGQTRWHEGRGWLFRVFTISTDDEGFRQIAAWAERFNVD